MVVGMCLWVWRRHGGIMRWLRDLKNWLLFESVNQDPKRMEEAIANHVFQNKEKETIDRTLSWLHSSIAALEL
jgi:hypothetical protein